MPPRWLKPIDRIETDYSTVTFAISDPDGAITSTLLKGRAALFGKEVEIQRWVDKPALVQCLHCHALGHIKTSRACPLGKDSVKCYICGGSHQSETHNQKCARKHVVAGICDCRHFMLRHARSGGNEISQATGQIRGSDVRRNGMCVGSLCSTACVSLQYIICTS